MYGALKSPDTHIWEAETESLGWLREFLVAPEMLRLKHVVYKRLRHKLSLQFAMQSLIHKILHEVSKFGR